MTIDACANARPLSLIAVLLPAIVPMLVVVTLRIPLKELVLSLPKALT